MPSRFKWIGKLKNKTLGSSEPSHKLLPLLWMLAFLYTSCASDVSSPPPSRTPEFLKNRFTLQAMPALGKSRLESILQVKARIEKVSDIQTELVLLPDTQLNAYAWKEENRLMVGVNLGLLQLIGEDWDQLAFVLGHEIAHHKKNHQSQSAQQAEQIDTWGSVIGIGMDLVGLPLGGSLVEFGGFAIKRKYSRDSEREADQIGLLYMYQAGFDPQAAVRFNKNLLAHSKKQLIDFLSTHPVGEERINELEQWTKKMPLP
ncbi:MAG: M48 family metalloprotease [Magnetococcus sp. DMHC-6]